MCKILGRQNQAVKCQRQLTKLFMSEIHINNLVYIYMIFVYIYLYIIHLVTAGEAVAFFSHPR